MSDSKVNIVDAPEGIAGEGFFEAIRVKLANQRQPQDACEVHQSTA